MELEVTVEINSVAFGEHFVVWQNDSFRYFGKYLGFIQSATLTFFFAL